MTDQLPPNFDPLVPNRENIQLWVDGLLSDEFKQGTGRLASCDAIYDWHDTVELGPKRLCCLGVAAEIAIRHGVVVEVERIDLQDEVIFKYDGHRDFMPQAVRLWLGLNDSNPMLKVVLADGTETEAPAAALNDGEVETPDSIAWRQQTPVGGDEESAPPTVRYLPMFTFREIAAALKHTYLRQEGDAEDQ